MTTPAKVAGCVRALHRMQFVLADAEHALRLSTWFSLADALINARNTILEGVRALDEEERQPGASPPTQDLSADEREAMAILDKLLADAMAAVTEWSTKAKQVGEDKQSSPVATARATAALGRAIARERAVSALVSLAHRGARAPR